MGRLFAELATKRYKRPWHLALFSYRLRNRNDPVTQFENHPANRSRAHER